MVKGIIRMELKTHNPQLITQKTAALILQLTSYVEAGSNAAGSLLLFVVRLEPIYAVAVCGFGRCAAMLYGVECEVCENVNSAWHFFCG